MGRSKKSSKIGSSSSNSAAEDMADNSGISYPVKDVIDALRKAMEAGFDGLDKLRYELTNDIEQIRTETQGLKQSLEFTQGDVAVMKEKAEMDLQKTNEERETLRKRITSLELHLQT